MTFAPRWRRAAQGPRHRHRSAADSRGREPPPDSADDRRTLPKGGAKQGHAAHGRQESERSAVRGRQGTERNAAHGRQQEPAPGFVRGFHVRHSSAPGHREAWAFACQGIRVPGAGSGGRRIRSCIGERGTPQCRERDDLAPRSTATAVRQIMPSPEHQAPARLSPAAHLCDTREAGHDHAAPAPRPVAPSLQAD